MAGMAEGSPSVTVEIDESWESAGRAIRKKRRQPRKRRREVHVWAAMLLEESFGPKTHLQNHLGKKSFKHEKISVVDEIHYKVRC